MVGEPKRFPCIEATLDVPIGDNRLVRLWLNRNSLGDVIGGHGEQYQALVKVREFAMQHPKGTFTEWMEFLATLPKVNAAQIQYTDLDGTKWGAVVYTVEFDGHG